MTNSVWEKCLHILGDNISECKTHATSGLAISSRKTVMFALLIKGKRVSELLKIDEKVSRI